MSPLNEYVCSQLGLSWFCRMRQVLPEAVVAGFPGQSTVTVDCDSDRCTVSTLTLQLSPT